MKHTNLFFLFFLIIFGTMTCTKPEADKEVTLEQEVDNLIAGDKYKEALTLLEGKENSPEVEILREKTHLNYGLFLEYRDSDATNMRDKMNNAMLQYIEVLRINPDNEKARAEIDQILSIYQTFPDREPTPEVKEGLEEVGYEFN